MSTLSQEPSASLWQQRIIGELQHIPEPQLAELYKLIHYFRLGLEHSSVPPRQPGLLKGQLGTAFFEPLPEEELRARE